MHISLYVTPKSWQKPAKACQKAHIIFCPPSRFKAFLLFFMEAVFRLHPSFHKILNPITRSDFGCSHHRPPPPPPPPPPRPPPAAAAAATVAAIICTGNIAAAASCCRARGETQAHVSAERRRHVQPWSRAAVGMCARDIPN